MGLCWFVIPSARLPREKSRVPDWADKLGASGVTRFIAKFLVAKICDSLRNQAGVVQR
jgi:hypothetical protein